MASLVTVLMPIFNSEETLAETLDTIWGQTYTQFELLAIDDGSTDHSLTILKDAQTKDNRVRILMPGRVGLVNALNLGLQAATGSYVARMDGDDRMHPERLQKQVAILDTRHEIDLVACQVDLFPVEEVKKGFSEYMAWQNNCISGQDIDAEIYWEAPFVHPSVMFRRARILELGGYRQGLFPEDYDLWLRMNQARCQFYKIPQVLLFWREHADRLTRTDPRYARAAFDDLRSSYLAQDPRLNSGRKIVVWGAGRITRKRVNKLVQHGFSVHAWIDIDPKKIGQRIASVRVHPPEWLLTQQEKPLVLSYVANHGARQAIEFFLEWGGYKRGADYIAVG